MPVLASTFLLLAVQNAPVMPAAAAVDVVRSASPDVSSGPVAGLEATTAAREGRELQTLARFEAALSVGRALSAKDSAQIAALVADSPSPRVRATAAAVLAWLDPAVSVVPLLKATRDSDPTVRVTAAQSLIPLARRLDLPMQDTVAAVAVALVDDVDDEVACAGIELLAVAGLERVADVATDRAEKASDVRYACLARFAGVPIRAVKLPTITPSPRDAPDGTDVVVSPDTVLPLPAETQWLFVADAAAAGLLIGGAIPSGLVPARDVLVYDDDSSRRSRQDISFATTVGSALLGGAAFGTGAYVLDATLGPLDSHEAIAVVGGTGSGLLLGAGLGFMLDPDGGGGALLLAGTTAAGVIGSTALAYATDLSSNDNAFVASSMAMGALLGGLGTFAAMPVAVADINGVPRTDFGFGAVVAGAGAFGLVALGASPFVEVTAARSAAVAAGGFLGAGLVGGIGLLAVPGDLETGSRISAGLGAGGQVLGMVLGALVPGDWLDEPAAITAVPSSSPLSSSSSSAE